MSTTVLEALQNAQINFDNLGRMGLKENPIYFIASEQLKNAIEALLNGKGIDFVIQENMFGEIK
jgi:hypothetical protein